VGGRKNDNKLDNRLNILDFKLSPFSERCMGIQNLDFGVLPRRKHTSTGLIFPILKKELKINVRIREE
jgi:hypothetical protein